MLVQTYTIELEPGDEFDYKGTIYRVLGIDYDFRWILYYNVKKGIEHEGVFHNGHSVNLITKS